MFRSTKKNLPYSERVKRYPSYNKHRRGWRKTPRGQYWQHKSNAQKRRIPWEFTFESWWKLWQDSGHWEQRGHSPGQYCMGRNGDEGPYSPSNCKIITVDDNLAAARERVRVIRKYIGRSKVVTYETNGGKTK
jgi:hypothetical protein